MNSKAALLLRKSLPLIFVLFFTLFNLAIETPNPYQIPPAFGWLSNPSESLGGGHCSMSVQE